VEAASELVDDGGAAEFSLRLLAERTGSGTATLYRHFTGKQEILDLVADRVLGELPDDLGVDGDTPWPERASAYARAFYDVLERHPRAAPLFSGAGPSGPAGRAARERWLATLVDAGLPPAHAARIYTTMARYVVGFAVQLEAEAAAGARAQARENTSENSVGHAAPTSAVEFPATAAAQAHLAAPLREEFEYGLTLLEAGLRATHDVPEPGNSGGRTARH
jgi:AcrR family transcriptional regulator